MFGKMLIAAQITDHGKIFGLHPPELILLLVLLSGILLVARSLLDPWQATNRYNQAGKRLYVNEETGEKEWR